MIFNDNIIHADFSIAMFDYRRINISSIKPVKTTHKHWDIAISNDGDTGMPWDTRNIWDVGFIFFLG